MLHSLVAEAQPKRQDMLFAFSDSLQDFQPFTLHRTAHFRSCSDFPALAGLAFDNHLNPGVRLPCATQGWRNSRN